MTATETTTPSSAPEVEVARRAQLPEGELVAVEFTPEQAGEYQFTCGHGMLRGKVVVE